MTSHSSTSARPWAQPRLRESLPILSFWLSFAALNLLLFLPAYWFNRAEATFLPRGAGAAHLLGWRENLDPFRLSAELTLLAALWLFLPRLRAGRWARPFRALLAAAFLLALLYAFYETLSISFYAVDPVFYGQARLVWEELPFLIRGLNPPPGLVLGGLGALAGLALLLRALLRGLAAPLPPAGVGRGSRLLMGLLVLLVIGAGLRYGRALAAPRSAVSCLACKLAQNAADSRALAARVRGVEDLPFHQVYDYGGQTLLQRPDIYLIFVESYGDILLHKDGLRAPYLALLAGLEAELAADGWHSASALSESPTWGGGSWMAYTSAFFGLRVDSHPAYLALRDRFAEEAYPNLGRALQGMGYRYAHATPIAAELPAAEQARLERFFGVDRWLTYADLGYRGVHYGWGPSPPDQFALSRANALLQAESDAPLLFFMLTQNSHYPWQEVPPLAADYRDLDDPGAARPAADLTVARVDARPEDYLAAIEYELAFLTQFVREEVAEDALVILIGDHQPGYISRRADGFATPLHVLSKDAGLTAVFEQYGLTPGLVPAAGPALKHEGFYSLLMRALLQRYGAGDRVLPPYLPEGVARE